MTAASWSMFPALAAALASGQVSHAAIDADLFSDASSGALSGPMVPYLSLLPEHAAKLSLLPHAAADTDHPTRVSGAIQAVDQILEAIERRVVRNRVGDLAEGYTDAGARTPAGLGGVTANDLEDLRGDVDRMDALRAAAHGLIAALDGLAKDGAKAAGRDVLFAEQQARCVVAHECSGRPFPGLIRDMRKPVPYGRR